MIRETRKPTSEQWTLVWSSWPSPTFTTWTSLSYGSSGRHTDETFQSTWFLNRVEHNGAKLYGCDLSSSMFSIDKTWWNTLTVCYKHPCRPDPRPDQPYHQFPVHGMFGTPYCADACQNLWLNLCQWSQKMAFHPCPEIFGHSTTNTACFFCMQTCALMVTAFIWK